jgi:hypothetical protein
MERTIAGPLSSEKKSITVRGLLGPMHSKLLATSPSIETFAKRPIRQLSQTGQNRAAFVTTHWSIVLTARGESPEAREALENLCRNYWWPIYGFVRRQGHTPEEAQDLTQSFFAEAAGCLQSCSASIQASCVSLKFSSTHTFCSTTAISACPG